ncbi:uncharacterized protein LOC123320155 isoform X2 [Coccinella septempunctata]|uniref:uncharacterized protein LOC123320155 isoform X2 n=1 Tax=Coccinella septempunctata TaxID=41139 RepID=UPI001D07A92F|nr:uncharacterized protein LOC123320155 isoform X2 [Coccinella septempunctata]
MEISEYDQYVPERELNMNFRIPRKRTAEESFGAANDFRQTSYYDGSATKVPAYGNAGPRPSNYSNYRAMPGSQLPELNTTNKPPMMPAKQNVGFGTNQYSNQNNMGYIEYPKMNSQSTYNFNKIRDEPRDGPLWLGDPTNSNYFRENKNQPSNSNSGTTGRDLSSDGMSFYNRNRDVPLLGTRRQNNEGGQGDKPLGWNNTNSGSFRGNLGSDNYFRANNDFRGNHNDGNSFNGNYSGGSSQGFQNKRDFRKDNMMSNQEKFDLGQGGYNRGMPKKPGGFRFNENQKNANNRYWNKPERPKLPKPNIPPVTIPDATDNTLPKELREMFQPLFCKLCSLQMTSNVMAKMHYVSKNHEKKIRKYLVEHAEKTGEPLHPRATVTAAEKKEKEEDKNPRNFYCELCDLQLTGKQHADSHYMGKSHNAVRMGKKRPAGRGTFDPTGKWVRKSKEETVLAEGDDPFGLDFRKKPEETKAPSTEGAVPKPPGKTREQFTCSLCSVSCVSQEQLNIHLSGSKHKKKLKLNGLSLDNFVLPKDSDKQEGNVEKTAENAIATDQALKVKYITPNGFFYCKSCNLTVNSEIQFKQHLDSKNHAKKANAKKTE